MAGVHAVDLAHADANRGLVVGQQDGVGLHAADCTPCEHEVLQRVSVGGLAGHELPGVRIVADGVDQISVLHKQAAIDLADGLVALRRLGHLEDAQVLLLGLQQFERGRLIVGGDVDFGENRAHAFGHLKGDLGVAGDHTAVGAHRVAGVSLLVGLGRGRADGQTARIVVLDYGHGNGGSHIPYGAPGGVRVHVVVVAHRLAAELLGVGETGLVERVDVEGGLLVGVLAVAQGVRTIPGAGELGRELGGIDFSALIVLVHLDGVQRGRLGPVLGGPLVDGGVIGGGVREGLGGKPLALVQGEAGAVGHAGGDQCIIGRVGDDGHGGVVLGRAAHHGGTADVDLLDGIGLVGAGAHGVGERVQVDDHQVERLDAELLELLGVLGVGHISQNAGVNVRVQRLDAAVEAFGESGDIGHLGYLDAQFGKLLGGRTSGNNFGAGLHERFREYFDAFLMKDRDQCSTYRSVRVCHPVPPWILVVVTLGTAPDERWRSSRSWRWCGNP